MLYLVRGDEKALQLVRHLSLAVFDACLISKAGMVLTYFLWRGCMSYHLLRVGGCVFCLVRVMCD